MMPLIAGGSPLLGVDVASYQGKPDWQRVHAAGMHALDPFLPGCYHFLRGDADPIAQARHFHATAGDTTRAAVALDVEPTTGPDMAAQVLDALRARLET